MHRFVHRALTDVRVRLRGRALAMPVEGLGWMRLLATRTTSFPENFFSSSRTRRGCTFWKAFSSRYGTCRGDTCEPDDPSGCVCSFNNRVPSSV